MECQSCGGKLKKKGKKTYQCTNCDSSYYVSMSFWQRITLELSVQKIVLIVATAVMLFTIVGIVIYQAYTTRLMKDASRFSGVFRDFLLQAYNTDVADISEEDLSELKFLRIRYEEGYLFEYGFQNPYDFAEGVDAPAYELRSITINTENENINYIPEDITYFQGLTKLELLAGPWADYKLPKNNVIRSITCQDGLSVNRYPELFKQINPETLEEVVMYAAKGEELKDLTFLEDIQCVKRLHLEKAVLTEANVLAGFDKLEEVYLEYPVMEEKQVFEIVEGILQCSSLKKLTIEGKSGWYITNEEWDDLLQQYGERVQLERK